MYIGESLQSPRALVASIQCTLANVHQNAIIILLYNFPVNVSDSVDVHLKVQKLWPLGRFTTFAEILLVPSVYGRHHKIWSERFMILLVKPYLAKCVLSLCVCAISQSHL